MHLGVSDVVDVGTASFKIITCRAVENYLVLLVCQVTLKLHSKSVRVNTERPKGENGVRDRN